MSPAHAVQQSSLLDSILNGLIRLLFKFICFARVTLAWAAAFTAIVVYYPQPWAFAALVATLAGLLIWFIRTRSAVPGSILPGVAEVRRTQMGRARLKGQDLAKRLFLLTPEQIDAGFGTADRLSHPAARTGKPVVVEGWRLIAPGGDPKRLRQEIVTVMDIVQGIAVEVTGAQGYYSVIIHRVPPPDPFDLDRPSEEPAVHLRPLKVGRFQDGTDAYIDLRDASHIAIQGMSRSGKSVFCYGLLSQLSNLAEVRMMGIDPSSLLLMPWESRALSGDIALGSDPVRSLAVLDRAVNVMTERFEELWRRRVEKLENFTTECPLVVVVLEEFPGIIRAAENHDAFLKPADRLVPRIRGQVGRLVSEGAKVGIRVIIVAQRADASIVEGSTRAQLGTRITFAVDNGDAIKMLHPVVDPDMPAVVRSFPVGRCLFWHHRQENIMQSDVTDYSTTYLDRVERGVRDA